MQAGGKGLNREEIIKQVQNQEISVRNFSNYIPIGNAPEKLKKWADQGAEICYLSALTENKKSRGDEVVGADGLKADELVLKKYNFPIGEIYHRELGENYCSVVERIIPYPNILIEDDCESMGAEAEQEITYNQINSELRKKIKSILIKEFGGIDHLPDDVNFLLTH